MKKITNSIYFYPILAISVSVFIGVIHLIIIILIAEDKKWLTATNLLVTALSIIIGTMISLITFESQQKQKEKKELAKQRKNLQAEVSDINRVLTSNDYLTIDNLQFIPTYIEPIMIKECAKSGLFSSKEIENLLHVSRKIEFYNIQVNYLLSLLAHSDNRQFEMLLQNCHKNIETTRKGILDAFGVILKQMELGFSDSINYK